MKSLPTDPERLREMLEKLKDKEMRLEADLAIKDCPAMEQAITELVLCIADCRRAEKTATVVERSDAAVQKRIETLRSQIAYYENKIRTFKATLAELEDPDSDGPRFSEEAGKFRARLRKHFDDWVDAFSERGVELETLIPQLNDFLG